MLAKSILIDICVVILILGGNGIVKLGAIFGFG